MKAVNAIVVALALAGAGAGCSGSSSSTPPPPPPPQAKEAVTNDSVVMQISHPDEAMKTLAGVAQPDDWKKFLNVGTAVSSTDKIKVAAAIGAQSANGVAAEYVGDNANAEKLATSIKGLADRLSLKSAAIESLVAKASADFKEPDADKRSKLVRVDIAQIQQELKATLDQLGDGSASTMMVFGAWIEGVRMASGVLQTRYDATASDVLNRKNEADYFLSTFAAVPAGGNPLYAQLKPALTKLRDAMTAGKSHDIGKASVDVIQASATEIANLLRS